MNKLILLGCVIVLAGCSSRTIVLPSDLEHAKEACAVHEGWAFFKKNADYMATEKAAPLTVYCNDNTAMDYYPVEKK